MRRTLLESAESMLKRLGDFAHFNFRILRQLNDVRRHSRRRRKIH